MFHWTIALGGSSLTAPMRTRRYDRSSRTPGPIRTTWSSVTVPNGTLPLPRHQSCTDGSFRETLANLLERLAMVDSVPGPDIIHPELLSEGIPTAAAVVRYEGRSNAWRFRTSSA